MGAEGSGAHEPPDVVAHARLESLDLRAEWRANAPDWVRWARAPGHDSYWRFHRDQFLGLVPAPGRLTLDIGCGEGRVARDLGARGHRVVALDVSAVLASAAQEQDPALPVCVADAARLPLRGESADLAVAFMSLQDVDDLHGAVQEAARVLRPDGRLCLALVHPLNSAGEFASRAPDSPFVVSGSYLEPSFYVDEVEHDGLAMRFASAHRPLADYVGALSAAGFLIEELHEHGVPESAIRAPKDRRWQRVPLFLHLRAVRR